MTQETICARAEEWYPFPGLEDFYEMSRSGRIRSKDRYVNSPIAGGQRLIKGREIKLADVRGYPALAVRENGKRRTKYIHHAIAKLFVPNPENKPCINHIDGNKTNNCPENLEWVTHLENMRHAYANGLARAQESGPGEKSPAAKLTWEEVWQIRTRAKSGERQCDLARAYGVRKGTIGMITANKTWIE